MQESKYKTLLFFVVNALIFLNLITYNGIVKLTPFPAYVIDLMLFILFMALYIKKRLSFPWENKIFLWLIYYFVINLIYFVFSEAGPDEFQYLKVIIFYIFFIVYTSLFFNLDDEELTLTRKTLLVIGVIATITLVIDYIDPGFFFKPFLRALSYYEPGRAAATYMNANIAGGAMVLFLIFTIDLIPKKWRFLYIFILFIGLFATMSRSNIMIFLFVLVIMFFQKKLNSKHLSIFFIAFIMFFTWLSNGGLEYLGDKFEFKVTENMINRVNFFTENKKADVSDMQERKMILKAALEMFENKPIFGNGFASTRLWQFPVAPHNTFAVHWAEFGFFGMLIIPLLLYLSTYDIFRYGTERQKQMAILVIIFFTFSCFFSHNMLEQQLDVAALVMLSVMGYKSKIRYHKQHKVST